MLNIVGVNAIITPNPPKMWNYRSRRETMETPTANTNSKTPIAWHAQPSTSPNYVFPTILDCCGQLDLSYFGTGDFGRVRTCASEHPDAGNPKPLLHHRCSYTNVSTADRLSRVSRSAGQPLRRCLLPRSRVPSIKVTHTPYRVLNPWAAGAVRAAVGSPRTEICWL